MASTRLTLKVCVLSPGPPWAPGGVEASSARLITWLDEWGYDWIMVTSSHGGGSNPRILLTRTPNNALLKRLLLGWKLSWQARQLQPDVVHVHGAEYGWGLWLIARVGRLVSGVRKSRPWPRVIVTCHGSLKVDLESGQHPLALKPAVKCVGALLSWIESRVFKVASFTTHVSASVKETLSQMYGLDPARAFTIPNGIDVARPSHRSLPTRSPLDILWVGNGSHRKNLRGAIAVLHAAQQSIPSARLIVVGTTGASLPGVFYKGIMGTADLEVLYLQCRLLVSTSTYEADPIVVKEALSSALPVVTSTPANAVVEHGMNGMVLPSPPTEIESVRAMADAVVQLLSQDDLWRRLSHGAKESCSQFTMAQERERYRALYCQLMKSK